MVLENKLGISNSSDLAREEERISKIKAIEFFKTGYFDNLDTGTFNSLVKIHKYLFDEIYSFAGEVRTENIAKGNFRFAPVMYLNASLEHIDNMPQSTFDEIIELKTAIKRDIEAIEFVKNIFKGSVFWPYA